MWRPLLLLIYPLLMSFCGGVCFKCPEICRCSQKSITCNSATENMKSRTQSRLVLNYITLRTISSRSFDRLKGVKRIEIAQSISLETIETEAFNSLLNVSEISIQNTRSLVHIHLQAFNHLPKLRYLGISNTGISVFPDLTSIFSLEPYFILDICDNLNLRSVPSNAFSGMMSEFTTMNLFNNGFQEIESHAFNGTIIDKLVLKNNKDLRLIHEDAFKNAFGPTSLDVSSTALETLPSHGLESVLMLVARSAFALKRLPPLKGLKSLRDAQLTYPSHCCALLSWDSYREGSVIAALRNGSSYCDDNSPLDNPSEIDDSLILDGPVAADIVGSTSAEDTFGSVVEFQYPELDQCQRQPALQCSPEADAFNPCEDIAGFGFLRVAIWFINVLAIAGNLTVLLVIFTSRCKLTVPRFLMCHLAIADLCIGVYLLMIATVDLRTRGHYSEHAIEWQTGAGCGIAGFLSVFGGELSVYTLSTITVERWHTITHALRLERRLGLSHASAIMVAGWLLCLVMALLPLMGVSSYNKVSMCLPMDIETPLSQAYVILLLLFNVGAFLVICGCYVCIYTAVRNPEFPGRAADTKIAKRMAVLIFTDFLCMAPISFFAISAAFKVPLITVTNSKILLVLFYPINSCANPFLYAIFTRAFRKDACILLSSMGCCESKANLYRMKTYCSENINRSKSSSGSNANSKAPRAVMWMSSFPHLTPRPQTQRV
ncbi:lutropin-choriogonadotropic hormone receptor [Ctenopharyngodon idella]|uniref:Lutropin-choriogonadotropic hormone receptor n=1 Tax=Ctenopharyngodon idella TaxID=7959 RepID=A2ICQ6_CTEID|nr:lutropin-choriogonadotropic hormone receptor [Ctenopharyngodon idella]ABM73668.1 luteinizing hormone receptor [Ctenopharyngodon idella]